MTLCFIKRILINGVISDISDVNQAVYYPSLHSAEQKAKVVLTFIAFCIKVVSICPCHLVEAFNFLPDAFHHRITLGNFAVNKKEIRYRNKTQRRQPTAGL